MGAWWLCLSMVYPDIRRKQRFGRLRTIEPAKHETGRTGWKVECECGTVKVVIATMLRKGLATSCGCYRTKNLTPGNVIHGHATGSHSPTYNVWKSMRARCNNPKRSDYARYGGAGITVDPRWDSFANFLADMGERPSDPPGWDGRVAYWTLDRIDPSRGYGPDNCRWATWSEQARNRRPRRKRAA